MRQARSPRSASPSCSRLLAVALAALALALLSGCFRPKTLRPAVDPLKVQEEVRKQKEYIVRQFLEKQRRVRNVAWPLLKANAPLCANTSLSIGALLESIHDVSPALRHGYAEILGMGERITVTDVPDNTPAQKAGLLPGDVILGLGDEALPEGKDARRHINVLAKKHMKANGTLTMRIERSGVPMDVTMVAERICNYPVFLVEKSVVNAYATGNYIVVYTGLLPILADDNELALIIGHELAHNTCGHIKSTTLNAWTGYLIGGLLTALTGADMTEEMGTRGVLAYTQEFEFESDYVGIYYTARAGYDITYVSDTWRKLSVGAPSTITSGSTHPAHAERYVALEAAVKEIHAKQAAGKTLQPEFKGQSSSRSSSQAKQ
ncbi:MAG: M48 family metallopeptidase [Thermodesulfobacteriota bacterium]